MLLRGGKFRAEKWEKTIFPISSQFDFQQIQKLNYLIFSLYMLKIASTLNTYSFIIYPHTILLCASMHVLGVLGGMDSRTGVG